MGKHVDDRVQGLDRPFGGSGNVEHEALTDSTRDTTREAPEGADGAHGLGHARGLAFDDRAGRLRREVRG